MSGNVQIFPKSKILCFFEKNFKKSPICSKKVLHYYLMCVIIKNVEGNYILPFYPIHIKTEKVPSGAFFVLLQSVGEYDIISIAGV